MSTDTNKISHCTGAGYPSVNKPFVVIVGTHKSDSHLRPFPAG